MDVYSRGTTRAVSTLTSQDFYTLTPPKTFLQIQMEYDLDAMEIYYLVSQVGPDQLEENIPFYVSLSYG